MDKSWMSLDLWDERYVAGVLSFIDFVRFHRPEASSHVCPCKDCRLHRSRLSLDQIYIHLIRNGIMQEYSTWIWHGEVDVRPCSTLRRHQGNIYNDSDNVGTSSNCVMNMLNDAFPYHGEQGYSNVVEEAYEKYQRLVSKAQTSLYDGADKTVLDSVLRLMQIKVESRQSDKSFGETLKHIHDILPSENSHPKSYKEVKSMLKDMGMSYQTIHACEHGCILYYKENKDLDVCPICDEPRYVNSDGKVPRKVVRYFPLTPRLQRLYMSPHVAKEMRWHGERIATEGDIRHPSDGEAWKQFDRDFPEFGSELRNVRLGISSDGFNPFGAAGVSYSTWPIVLVPYNLPSSMCLKKEFNILALLISGPKSPKKCLSVFMKPLIDELKILWGDGIDTLDRYDNSTFRMRAAVLWTISDFPGLGMLGGLQTKGYKACPLCLSDVDSEYLGAMMVYCGHRRWLDVDHPWRTEAHKFNGKVELRGPPPVLTGEQIYDEMLSHDYPTLSSHPKFQQPRGGEKLCWTHVTIFYELPYWTSLRQPYSLDVMHIEKNVFDNIFGTILGLDGKTRDGVKARAGWKIQGVHRHLWVSETGRVPPACFTVSPAHRERIFELIGDVKYPHGYAGSLTSKINISEKKFIGLKTHDCHVLLQRLLPVVIRPYLPSHVVVPLIALSRWFQQLCSRELKASNISDMQEDITIILCKFERIFPPAFFTIMVHLLIHLPEQVLLKGPVHFSWMYPIERQLGQYKKFVRNTRYPEGCIAEEYILQECITFCKLYLGPSSDEPQINEDVQRNSRFKVSVVSELVQPGIHNSKMWLTDREVETAHWCVLENCDEARPFINEHKAKYYESFPHNDDKSRKIHFRSYFLKWMRDLKKLPNSPHYNEALHILARWPQAHACYKSCYVNGAKFLVWESDHKLRTQNSGVMVESEDDEIYYGILENVIKLQYGQGMSVVLFKCQWFDTDLGNTKLDHGLLSIDSSSSWFEESPYCVATTAKQVFYLDDPKMGEPWKIVIPFTPRGTYNAQSLARMEDISDPTIHQDEDEPYQEDAAFQIQGYVDEIMMDDDNDDGEEQIIHFEADPNEIMMYDDDNEDDEDQIEHFEEDDAIETSEDDNDSFHTYTDDD